MKDTKHLKELIMGLMIVTPLACQSTPEKQQDTQQTQRTTQTAIKTQTNKFGERVQSQCMTFDEIFSIQDAQYKADNATWDYYQKNTNPPMKSLPPSKPVKPTKPTTCPKSFVYQRIRSRCQSGTRSWYQDVAATVPKGKDCCYQRTMGPRRPCGRLFYVEDTATVATTEHTHDWMGQNVDAPEQFDDDIKAFAAKAWLDDALEEHASIAAFSRATLELMRLGAPAQLLERYQVASIEEIDHARQCFALVNALTGQPASAGRLEVEGPRQDLRAIIEDVFWGGCVGESVAALCATRASTQCVWSAAQKTLHQISEEEASHAALAWSTMYFFASIEPAMVLEILQAAKPPQPTTPKHRVDDAQWMALGRLTPAQEATATMDAWRSVIEPFATQLIQDIQRAG